MAAARCGNPRTDPDSRTDSRHRRQGRKTALLDDGPILLGDIGPSSSAPSPPNSAPGNARRHRGRTEAKATSDRAHTERYPAETYLARRNGLMHGDVSALHMSTKGARAGSATRSGTRQLMSN